MELKEIERALLSPTSSKYSLSSRASHSTGSHSSVSSCSSSCHRGPWQEQVDLDHDKLPSISPADHIKTLLSQLLSSTSSMKNAFAHLQAMLRAIGAGAKDGRAVMSPAEKVMVEELQRLCSLHMRLYSALQEQGVTKEDRGESQDAKEYMCRDAGSMLKSYEGVISRFHDEIRKKDAVVEALKETLAKSMLKGEKLERRVKTLEAKLSLK